MVTSASDTPRLVATVGTSPTFKAMATLKIHRLPEDVNAKLRVRAAKAGRSMEAEARLIRAEAVRQPEQKPVDLAALRAFMTRLYGGKLPSGVVDDFIAEKTTGS